MRAVILVAFAMVASCKKPDAPPATPSACAAAKPSDAHAAAAKTEAIARERNAAIDAHDAGDPVLAAKARIACK